MGNVIGSYLHLTERHTREFSNDVLPFFYAALVQFGGTSPCQGEGYGFEPRMLLHSKYSLGVNARPYSIRIEAHRVVRTINSVKNEAVTGKKYFDIQLAIYKHLIKLKNKAVGMKL